MYQALQFDDSRLTGDDVEIIYGEYISEKSISYVRDLSGFWKLSKIAQAKRLFDSKLNGKPLADEIRLYWDAGAKCLERLSEVVECNYSLQIPEVLKQINNAVKKFDTTAPQWVTEVKNDLAKISKRLTVKDNEKYPVSKTVLEYAKLLEEKSLTTQAVIALWVSVETAVVEYLVPLDSSKIGDYGWFHGYYDGDTSDFVKGTGKRCIDFLLGERKQDPAKPNKYCEKHNRIARKLAPLRDLEHLRNGIAHGGAKNRTGNEPHHASIPGILKKAFEAMDVFYLILPEYKP
jgi:hypothetical protein